MATRTSRGSESYHHGDLATALIESAVEIVAESGIAGLSLRAVARRAGVSHGAPAHHFASKAGLLTAVAVRGCQHFHDALIAARDAAGSDPVRRFSATGRAYVHFAVDQRPWFELMFRNELLDRNAPELIEATARNHRILEEAASSAQASGYARATDLGALVTSSWAMAHGLAILWLDGNLGDPDDRGTLEKILEQVFGPGAG